ncbi:hypothetical protein RB597_003835 [Gaeumannomyces tritici]
MEAAWGANGFYKAFFFLLLIISGASQFSSTILLADIGPVKILRNYNTSKISIALQQQDEPLLGTGKSYWASRAPAYFRFAEKPGFPNEGEEYYDTGTTIRAFLPLGSPSQRAAVRSYAGVTSAFNARVACVRPRLTVSSGSMTMSHLFLDGNLSGSSGEFLVNGSGMGEMLSGEPFSLLIGNAQKTDFNTHKPPLAPIPISMYAVGNKVPAMKSGGWPESQSKGDAYLLINLTAHLTLWPQFMTSPNNLSAVQFFNEPGLVESNSSGIWQRLRINGSSIGIDATLCFFNPADGNYHITADSTRDGQEEPSPRWWNNRTGEYGTEAARDFLGTALVKYRDLRRLPRTPKDRGLLSMGYQDTYTNWRAALDEANEAVQPKIGLNIWDWLLIPTKGTSIYLNTAKPEHPGSMIVPHPSHASLFQSVMANTNNNAALALQAVFTTLMQIAYYDLLADSNLELNSTMVFSRDVVIPHQWAGFYVFCTIFTAHFLLIMVVVTGFADRTSMSYLGNAWHAVAQVVAEAPPDLDFWGYTDKTDGQVETDLRRKTSHPPIRIGTSAASKQERKGNNEEAE